MIQTRNAGVEREWAIPAITAVVGTLLAAPIAGDLLPSFAIGAFAYTFAWYVYALGRRLAIVETMALIASAQWLLGPFLAYHFGWSTVKYRMYVEEGSYFAYALPAYLLMLAGLNWTTPKVDVAAFRSFLIERYSGHMHLGFSLIAIGVAASFLDGLAPAPVRFVLFLAAQLKFVGATYLIIYKMKGRWLAATAVLSIEVMMSAELGMFHNLLLWTALLFSLLCLDLKAKLWTKLALIIAGLLTISSLQTVKSEYRQMMRQNSADAGIVKLVQMVAAAPLGATNMSELNSRLNQGWIVSAVMRHVPAYVPFENGRTIQTAVVDSLVPRALIDKRIVSQSDSFRRYTGLPTYGATTFGISVLGEAWVNFGWWGAVFVGLTGVFYGLVFRLLVALGRREPTMILWAPLLFLQALKAETEFVVVLNHVTKGLIFVLIAYFIVRRVTTPTEELASTLPRVRPRIAR